MIKTKDTYITSTNGINKLHMVYFEPSIPPRGIIQISHGMIDHIYRYTRLAEFLTSEGFLVVGHDHIGHGLSVSSKEEFGYFNTIDGSATLVNDLHLITQRVKKEYPQLPYFLLGHSMGSFIVRRYLSTYNEPINGAIILGTAHPSALSVHLGKFVIGFMGLFKSPTYRSSLVQHLLFGHYNKKYKSHTSIYDWLTCDTKIIQDYIEDELCQFSFTLNGYEALFNTLNYITQPKNMKHLPLSLPILIASGADDPVGNYGKDVTKTFNSYKAQGIQDIQLKLYPNCRHELFNESNPTLFFKDLLTWLTQHL